MTVSSSNWIDQWSLGCVSASPGPSHPPFAFPGDDDVDCGAAVLVGGLGIVDGPFDTFAEEDTWQDWSEASAGEQDVRWTWIPAGAAVDDVDDGGYALVNNQQYFLWDLLLEKDKKKKIKVSI